MTYRTNMEGRETFPLVKDLYFDYQDFIRVLEKTGFDVAKVDENDYNMIMEMYGSFETKYTMLETGGKLEAAFHFTSAYNSYERYKKLYEMELDDWMKLNNTTEQTEYIGDYSVEDKDNKTDFVTGRIKNTRLSADMVFLNLSMNENPRLLLYKDWIERIVYPLQRNEPIIYKRGGKL